MAGEILEEVRELLGPGVLPLVDPEHLVPIAPKPEGEVRADLAGGSGEQNLQGALKTNESGTRRLREGELQADENP